MRLLRACVASKQWQLAASRTLDRCWPAVDIAGAYIFIAIGLMWLRSVFCTSENEQPVAGTETQKYCETS